MTARTKTLLYGAGCLAIATTAAVALIPPLMKPQPVRAQSSPPVVIDVPLGSLKTVPTPTPPLNLENFLRNDSQVTLQQAKQWAIVLGKALFWDQAVGSDGTANATDAMMNTTTIAIGQACASCHFNAGADSRIKNQLNPEFRAIPPDSNFTSPFTTNYRLTAADFPFHRLVDPNNRFSAVSFDTNDVASSQGVFRKNFVDIVLGNPQDQGTLPNCPPEGPFNCRFQSPRVREVEPRNTPAMINAVFNFRNFWDGRARNEFNGVNPIGDLDPFARVLLQCVVGGVQLTGSTDPMGKCTASGGDLQKVRLSGTLRLENSSLASQAVGPPLSDLEMSFNGRIFPKLGKKMLALSKALPNQLVDPSDSVLGTYSAGLARGLSLKYSDLIQKAFSPRWWASPMHVTIPGGTDRDSTITLNTTANCDPTIVTTCYTQMEYNFSLFWGLSIQMYESTLRADDSRFDRFFDAGCSIGAAEQGQGAIDSRTQCLAQLNQTEQTGLILFQGKAKCIACHGGPETTNASVQNVVNEKLERMIMGNNGIAVYDNGFYNTAVRRCAGLAGPCDDVGIGATIGPNNLPLSMSRFFQIPQWCQFGTSNFCTTTQNPDGTSTTTCLTGCLGAPLIKARPQEGIAFNLLQPNERVAVDGAFKTPGLRNVELTAPYFHNGGDATLMDTINFYNRGGNFPEFNQNNLDPDIVILGLTADEKAALVALLKAMTDERSRCQQDPFDHPQLFVPDLPALAGFPGVAPLTATIDTTAYKFGEVKAVGKSSGCVKLPTFAENLAQAP